MIPFTRRNSVVRALIAAVAVLATGSAVAQADSVGSAGLRGGLGVSLGGGGQTAASNGGFTNLLTGVPMTSSEKVRGGNQGNIHYGPFRNASNAALNITLATRYESSISASVNGATVGSSPYTLTFVVPPGAEYVLAAQDGAQISAWTNVSGLTLADFGLPSAADFAAPVVVRGEYLGCQDALGTGRIQGEFREIYYGTRWWYRAVSRSDGSHIEWRHAGMFRIIDQWDRYLGPPTEMGDCPASSPVSVNGIQTRRQAAYSNW